MIDAVTDNIPEPLAGLIRDHRRIEQRLGEATRTGDSSGVGAQRRSPA